TRRGDTSQARRGGSAHRAEQLSVRCWQRGHALQVGGSMALESVECWGDKAFRDFIRLDLAPLTVIFGKNNSGKTTLGRLPLFVMASFVNRKMYALSAKEARFGSSFADLASSDQPHPRVVATLSWTPSRMLHFDLQRVVSGSGGESVQLRELQL